MRPTQRHSAAGYHAVAPDQRGYGASDRPTAIDQYSIFHLVGDVVALIRELGEEQAVVIGHDWGSIVAWNTALLRPAVVRGVVGISVPPIPRGTLPPLTVTEQRFGPDFYQNYFQEPGIADAELNKDVEGALRRIYAGVPAPEPTPGFAGRFLNKPQPGKTPPSPRPPSTSAARTTAYEPCIPWTKQPELSSPTSAAQSTSPTAATGPNKNTRSWSTPRFSSS
ncbi:alpha/beta fold hydrolase [Kribbella yunnanensis]|uniref:alpha/beta fold hydrolase n=1 Tax=Kribbella yunnanensis TaxID=190194 RepID=UPI003CD05CFC